MRRRRPHESRPPLVTWALAGGLLVAVLGMVLASASSTQPASADDTGETAIPAAPTATPAPIDEFSGTKQAGPGLMPAATKTMPASPIDAVRGDRVEGPRAATPAPRPIIIERDRGVDWTVPVLLFSAALTILGLGAIAAAVRSRR